MTFSVNKLTLVLVAGVIAAVGFASPASATASVSFVTNPAPSFYETSPTPAFELLIDNGQAFPASSASVSVNGWTQLQNCPTSFVAVPSAACGVANVVGSGGGTITNPQVKYMGGAYVFTWTPSGTPTAITVSFDPGAWTTGTAGSSTMVAVGNAGPANLSITVLSGSAPANATVTFDANGGSGSMSDQTSSSAIALTPNAFTRTNYNFAGWNTAADGSGTAYADAASYPFTSSATLYAQWTPTLANTGMSDVTWQMGEITLALMGFGILLYIRQRKRNA